MAEKAGTAVNADVHTFGDVVVLAIAASGLNTIPINLDPQSAFELGEKLARTAHAVRFPGEKIPDGPYLMEQIKARVTEDMRKLLIQRYSVMLNSMRYSAQWDNRRLATELVDTALAKLT